MAESQNTDANLSGGNNNMKSGDKGDSKWYESYPADTHEHVKDFDSPEAVVKDYISLKGRVPKVPEKPEDYAYDIPKDHPMPLSDQEVAAVRKFAKDAGLTVEQFGKVVNAQLGLRANYAKGQAEATKKAEDALKGEWGQSFDANLSAADATINKLFDADFNEFAKKSGIASHPAFIKGMFKLSRVVSEDAFERGGKTGDEATQKVDPLTGLPMLKYSKKQ